MQKILKLGIPKGSLQNATIDLFRRSGWKINVEGRSYFPDIDDETLECALCRAQEMSINVESGVIDAGLTGLDWVAEHESDVHVVTDLVYSKVSARPARWVVAVASESPIHDLKDLEGMTISTELVKFTKRFFKERNINVTVKFSWGATEAKIVSGLADAIVEITETESTIRAHNLRVIHEVMETNTQLIANKTAWQDLRKREKIQQIAQLLQGALVADQMVGIKMNVPENKIAKIVSLLPSLNAPTIAGLYQSDWYSVESIINTKHVRDLIPQLLKEGAEGIIEYPLNKVL
ncbi:MAG: ATP phosphoribosyltransferase [Desulfotignum sp.]|jgi:ATP phosphoribosyltransferase|nr:ATP phosphoribosyltransferase [Desulfotignum sp.]